MKEIILRFFKYMFLVVFFTALVLCGGYVYARYIEPSRLDTERVTIIDEDLPDEMNGLTIGLFSDTHVSNYFPPDTMLKKVVERLQTEKPDLILFTGDLFDTMITYAGDVEEVTELLSTLEAPYGKYAVYGNHDYQSGTYYRYRKILEDAGFRLLKNEVEVIEELNCNIIGLDESLLGYGTMKVAENVTNGLYNLVLSHEPDVILEAEKNVDLQVSGHTHGGQCILPIVGALHLPRLGQTYTNGRYDVELGDGSEAIVYVTSGIGMSKLPFRFLVPPEIVILTLKQR